MSKPGCMKEETVFLPQEAVAAIESELDYGDAKSAWIREAVEQRLARQRDDAQNSE